MTRVRLTFATLVVIAVAALGTLTRALAWSATPVTGLTVAASALVAVGCVALALRIIAVTETIGTAPNEELDIHAANHIGPVFEALLGDAPSRRTRAIRLPAQRKADQP